MKTDRHLTVKKKKNIINKIYTRNTRQYNERFFLRDVRSKSVFRSVISILYVRRVIYSLASRSLSGTVRPVFPSADNCDLAQILSNIGQDRGVYTT